MADPDFTTTMTGNDAAYVSGNQLADALMFISSTMRLIQQKDGEAFCLLEKAQAEIISAQDYLGVMDPIESPIDASVVSMLNRVGGMH